MSNKDFVSRNGEEPSYTDQARIEEALQLLPAEVERLLKPLDDIARKVITLRFGLEGEGEPQNSAEVAVALGISEEEVRQIEMRAFSILRHPQ